MNSPRVTRWPYLSVDPSTSTTSRNAAMSTSELIELARAVDARCRLRGAFVLRSGQVATEYFDKYLFESDRALLRLDTAQVHSCKHHSS